ncbi:MAG: hypothetical protein ACE5KT_12315 [Methanosarcinales archaeon]
MKKWSFIVEVSDFNKLKSIVEDKSKEVVEALGRPDSEKALYKVITTFFQKKERWLLPEVPRQDIGIDLDNLLKQVFDGLGPIIGYRHDYTGKKPGVLDSNIIEVYAKKVNSGSDKEFLGIEVELLHITDTDIIKK